MDGSRLNSTVGVEVDGSWDVCNYYYMAHRRTKWVRRGKAGGGSNISGCGGGRCIRVRRTSKGLKVLTNSYCMFWTVGFLVTCSIPVHTWKVPPKGSWTSALRVDRIFNINHHGWAPQLISSLFRELESNGVVGLANSCRATVTTRTNRTAA